MEPDRVAASAVDAETEVMAAVEGDGDEQRLVVADVGRDDAYVTLPLADAASLPAWR